MSRPPLLLSPHQAFPFAGNGYEFESPLASPAGYGHGSSRASALGDGYHSSQMAFRAQQPLGQQRGVALRPPNASGSSADLPAANANFVPQQHHHSSSGPASAASQALAALLAPPRQHGIAAATRVLNAPAFKQHLLQHNPLRNRDHHAFAPGEFDRMAANGAGASDFGPSEEELAQLQKLSAEYVPEVSGPLVSERIPTSAITAEYARADPVYQAKTAAIPQRYSYYRTCKGDGFCGWRAIGFCYYETLLRLGDKQKFLEEQARIRSLGNLLQAVGHSRDIYEDWEDEAIDLLRTLPTCATVEESSAALLSAFNDTVRSMNIITYLKVLTGAWMRTHSEDYEPFIQGQNFDDYVSRNIEATQSEIEHLGLSALFDVLLKPAGFALEVMYLDRSAGTELYPHRMEPTDNAGMVLPNSPTLRLLYRPGHYDILYSFEDTPPPSTIVSHAMNGSAPNGAPHAPVFVALASPTEDGPATGLHATPHQQIDFAGLMPIIPGMSGISAPGISGTQSLWMPSPPAPTGLYPASSSYDFVPQATGLIQRDYQPAHQPIQSQPPPPAPVQRIATSHVEQHYAPPAPVTTSASYMALPPPPTNSAEMFVSGIPMPQQHHSPTGAVVAPAVQIGALDRGGGPFRPSIWEYQSGWEATVVGGPNMRDNGFQTNIFKHSHFNTAHFNNPDFQPEEWTPGSEVSTERSRRKSTAPST
ncbi:cysteine proteinase [Rhizodiscina lignyota]|uniref:ubiquitinyl hydrolase 1 n=1 Tax=Rhizodiscina lignyota TaxID=1504668 RepID=A0A9P4INI1_9PEZI|nr:cysteine proteinase [Rhizodiscina lignyota]